MLQFSADPHPDVLPRNDVIGSLALRAAATAILHDFDLRFDEVRLMQTATGCLISGSTVAVLTGCPTQFSPHNLDMYTGKGVGTHIIRYLRKSGKYDMVSVTSSYDFAAGIGKVVTLRHRRTMKEINVIESLSMNPLDSILHFHFTPVFGAWSANSFWHGYRHLTCSGFAITTPAHLPLKDDLESHKHVWKVLRKYALRGFTFLLDGFRTPHTCGIHPNCPATPRTSDDAGCTTIAFPEWEFQSDAVSFKTSTWNMNGTGCRAGILAGGNIQSAKNEMGESRCGFWVSAKQS
jgi:hypothetical protein